MVKINMLIRSWLSWSYFAATLFWGGYAPSAVSAPANFADATTVGGKASLTLTTSFSAATEDAGRLLHAYMVALVPVVGGNDVYSRTAKQWVRFDGLFVPELISTLGSPSSQSLPIVNAMDVREIAGTRVYLGYGLDGTSAATPFDEMLLAQRYRLIHTIDAGWNDTGTSAPWALNATSDAGLTASFRASLGQAGSAYLVKAMLPYLAGAVASTAAPTATPDSTSSAAVFSGTTLQEATVDEADLIKSDGFVVFSLDKTSATDYRRDRIRRQRLDATAANAALEAIDNLKLPISADVGASGLYLDSPRQQLVTIAQGGFGWGIYDAWFSPLYWSQGVTEAVLIDASSPSQMKVRRTLRMNGQLIGSRRVGSTLYLVLRSYPQIPRLDPWWPADKLAANQSLVDALQAVDLLPTLSIDGGPKQSLVDAASCFIQKDNAAVSADIITIVGIDLAATGHHHAARCFTGGAEAFYLSEQSIYLATTRSSYTYSGAFPVYANQSSTDLHKFSLDGLNIVYRGSGNVTGHLGFDQNRKSFRMGEHKDMLRVITQTDTSFGGWLGLPMAAGVGIPKAGDPSATLSSPGHLSILQETAGTLALIGKLPNATRPAPLGKPGEQLYASRFLGERGYLVTYRLTDPLYVLDLSSPADPKIAGELQVSGYSDYLFPLSENLLLGVGKDAISDGSSGDGRFAWYQGVKVSLIDVTDPANPRESARAIVGRRGTDATVLRDHHGIAMQMLGRKVRVGLPVSLHDTPSSYSTGKPNDYFQFSRSELQRFEIDLDTQALQPQVALKSDLSGERTIENDRSLLWNDQVHYYQDGDWRSSIW